MSFLPKWMNIWVSAVVAVIFVLVILLCFVICCGPDRHATKNLEMLLKSDVMKNLKKAEEEMIPPEQPPPPEHSPTTSSYSSYSSYDTYDEPSTKTDPQRLDSNSRVNRQSKLPPPPKPHPKPILKTNVLSFATKESLSRTTNKVNSDESMQDSATDPTEIADSGSIPSIGDLFDS